VSVVLTYVFEDFDSIVYIPHRVQHSLWFLCAGPSSGWRLPFVLVSAPAILLAFLMLFTTEEPLRGGMESALAAHVHQPESSFVYTERLSWMKVWKLVRIHTNILIITQGLFGCLPWGMLLTFMNDYLSQNKGLSVATATTVSARHSF
jgi:predicted MFS family arabinose efflux permease